MTAEYKVLRLHTDETDAGVAELLNAYAAEGWTVKAAYSPTHFLLERTQAQIPQRAQPTPPTGPKRG